MGGAYLRTPEKIFFTGPFNRPPRSYESLLDVLVKADSVYLLLASVFFPSLSF